MTTNVHASTRPGLAPDYPHHRREIECATINCYTGCIRHLLAQQGHAIPEAHLWALGEGYCLEAALDEHEVPELRIEMFDVLDRFCAKTGTLLLRSPVEPARLVEQIAALTAEGTGIVAWVNSAYLRYSDLYYANGSYLHSVVIEGPGAEVGTIRLIDPLIVTMPPKACEVDIAVGDLLAGLTAPVSADTASFSKDYVRVRGPSSLVAETARRLKESLLASCAQNIALHEAASPILAWAASCERHRAGLDGAALGAFLRRINDNINTLHAVPNRNLFLRALSGAVAPAAIEGPTKEAAAAMLLSWKTLANLCLKASLTLSGADLARFRVCVDSVERDERRLWRAASELLQGGRP